MAGADPIPGVIGPMSTSLKGIKLFMKIIIDAEPWLHEPAVILMTWNPTLEIYDDQPLRIAIMWNDGVVTPHPPITRALTETATRLSAIPNVTVVDWKPYSTTSILEYRREPPVYSYKGGILI
jgi:amidase